LHFTATEILVHIGQKPEVTVTPGVRHDLESFFYVAVWAILIKSQKYDAALRSKDLTEDQNQKWERAKQFRTRLIKDMFGPHDIVSVTSGRLELLHSPFFGASALFPTDLKPEFDEFRDLWERLLKLFGPAVQSKRDITHAEVISALGELPPSPEHVAESIFCRNHRVQRCFLETVVCRLFLRSSLATSFQYFEMSLIDLPYEDMCRCVGLI
jgi:hypothetical protein